MEIKVAGKTNVKSLQKEATLPLPLTTGLVSQQMTYHSHCIIPAGGLDNKDNGITRNRKTTFFSCRCYVQTIQR